MNSPTKLKRPWTTIGLGKDRDYFIENLSLLVASGMPVTEVIDSIGGELRSGRMKLILRNIRWEIENGSPIWRALSGSRLFKDHTVSLIRLGEESGKLIENLRVVAIEEQKERAFRSKLSSAMMYPVFVLLLTVVIGVGIAWFILPKLAVVFAQLKIDLPLITKILIAGGTFLGAYGQYAVPAFAAVAVILFYLVFYFPPTKGFGHFILFSLPGIGQLMKEVELARFGYLLGTLLSAGLPVIQAIDSLARAAEFRRYRRFYEHLRVAVEEGNSFQKSLAAWPGINRLIPVPAQQLIVSGERSGHLADTLLNLGESYGEKSDQTTKNLTIILEPILLVIVWLGVVAVALAVILPIYGLVGGLNTN